MTAVIFCYLLTSPQTSRWPYFTSPHDEYNIMLILMTQYSLLTTDQLKILKSASSHQRHVKYEITYGMAVDHCHIRALTLEAEVSQLYDTVCYRHDKSLCNTLCLIFVWTLLIKLMKWIQSIWERAVWKNIWN
jgi:hypothetical protein